MGSRSEQYGKRTLGDERDRWDRCIQLPSGFLILAEKELSAFVNAVDKLFGAERARRSALDWIEELELMDWPSSAIICARAWPSRCWLVMQSSSIYQE